MQLYKYHSTPLTCVQSGDMNWREAISFLTR
jgi:hypothetical protein